jgi:hypothetical protein
MAFFKDKPQLPDKPAMIVLMEVKIWNGAFRLQAGDVVTVLRPVGMKQAAVPTVRMT